MIKFKTMKKILFGMINQSKISIKKKKLLNNYLHMKFKAM